MPGDRARDGEEQRHTSSSLCSPQALKALFLLPLFIHYALALTMAVAYLMVELGPVMPFISFKTTSHPGHPGHLSLPPHHTKLRSAWQCLEVSGLWLAWHGHRVRVKYPAVYRRAPDRCQQHSGCEALPQSGKQALCLTV